MFWTGAGVSISQGFYHLLHPPEVFGGHEVVLGVLLMSFAVDGYVLVKTLQEIQLIKPKDMTLWRYMVGSIAWSALVCVWDVLKQASADSM
jgi:hypothetical protein